MFRGGFNYMPLSEIFGIPDLRSCIALCYMSAVLKASYNLCYVIQLSEYVSGNSSSAQVRIYFLITL